MQHSKQPPPSKLKHAARDRDEEEQVGLLHQDDDSSDDDTASTASAGEKPPHPQPQQDSAEFKVSWLRKTVVVLLLAWTVAFIVHSFLAPHTYPDDFASTSELAQAPPETAVQSAEWPSLEDAMAREEGDNWVPRARVTSRRRRTRPLSSSVIVI